MQIFRKNWLNVIGLLLLASPSFSQVRLTYADALAKAVQNNPLLNAADARIQSAEGLRIQSGLSPNPRGIVQLENYRAWEKPPFSFANSPDNYALVSQLVERGAKRQRRLEAAGAVKDRYGLERDLLSRQIASRVAAAYWSAAAAEQIRRAWQQQVQSYTDLVSYSENRLREGVVSEADVLRAKVERNKAVLSAANAAQEAARARVNLFREMGQSEFSMVEFDDPSAAPASQLVPTMALVFQTRYELRVARQLVVEAQARLALQHANAKVDPDVSVGYKRTVGVDTVYAAVSVPLPFRNRNQGNIISADADVRTAKANLQALQNVILAEVAAAQEEFQLRNNLLSQTLPGLRRDAEETVRIARLAYREGGMDLLRLLDAERSRLDTEVLYFQSLSLFQQSVVNLQTATGAAPGSMAPESSPTPNPTKP